MRNAPSYTPIAMWYAVGEKRRTQAEGGQTNWRRTYRYAAECVMWSQLQHLALSCDKLSRRGDRAHFDSLAMSAFLRAPLLKRQ